MSVQYLRAASLVVGDKDGNGLDLSQLQIRFNVKHHTTQTLNTAEIRVLNPADQTAARVMKEFTQVILQAGYQDSIATIFKGTIKLARWGRENPVDTYLDIFAADADSANNYAVVNTTLAAGYTQADVHGALTKSMEPYGVTGGATPNSLGTQQSPRGKVCFGMTRDRLRDFAETNGLEWSVQDGQIQFVPISGFLPGEAIVLNSATGIIGIPRQTLDGIEVTCLLNPQIKPGRRVQINNKDVQQAAMNLTLAGEVQYGLLPSISRDGFYRVVWMEHTGDTRGHAWYTHAICWALDGNAPTSPSSLALDAGP